MYVNNQKIKEFSQNFNEFSKYNEFFLNNVLSFLSFKKEFDVSEEIKEGDLVKLKSVSSIKMMVTEMILNLGVQNKVQCSWEEDGKLKSQIFLVSVLEKCDS